MLTEILTFQGCSQSVFAKRREGGGYWWNQRKIYCFYRAKHLNSKDADPILVSK